MTIFGLRIQAVGVPAGQYRFATGIPVGDVDNLYRACLQGVPRVMMEADTHESRSSSVSTQATLIAETEFSLPSALVTFAEPSQFATLEFESGTTVDIKGPSIPGEVVHWRQEAILLGSAAPLGGGVIRYTGCTRGYLGTRERSLAAQYPWFPAATYDNAVVPRPWTLRYRKVTLFEVPEDGGYNDEVDRFHFIIDDLGNVEGNDHVILRLRGVWTLAEQEVLPRRAEYLVKDANGIQLDNVDFDVRVLTAESVRPVGVLSYYQPPVSNPSATTGDRILVKWRGSIFQATVTDSNFDGMHTIEFDPKSPWLGGTTGHRLEKRSEALRESVEEVVGTGFRANTSGLPASLGDDVLGVVMAILTSTVEGDNGPYDTGMDVGPGMDYTLFDLDDIEEVRGRIAGIDFINRFFLGTNDYTASAQSEVDKLLESVGLRATYGPTGLIRFRPWEDRPSSLSLEHFETWLTSSWGLKDVFDESKVTFSPDQHLFSDVRWISSVDVYRRQRVPGAKRAYEHRMVHNGQHMTAFALAQQQHYRRVVTAPIVTAKVSEEVEIWPMQAVTITGPGTRGADGLEDLVATYGTVVGVEWDFDRALKVVRVRIGYSASNLIGHALKVDTGSYGGGASVPVLTDHFVTRFPIDALTEDTDFFAVDDVVAIIDEDGAVSDTRTIQAVASGSVTLDAIPTVPVGQWYIVSADAGTATARQEGQFAYQEVDSWAH